VNDVNDAGDDDDDPLKWEKLYYGGNGNDSLLGHNNNNNNSDSNNGSNGNKSTMTSSASTTSSSPIKVITFDLDNTLWKTTPTISHANDVLADFLQTTLGFDKDTRVEHEMGRLFRRFPERYVGLSFSPSSSSGGTQKEMKKEKENEGKSNKEEEEESLATLVENVGQTPLSLSLDTRVGRVTNDDSAAENGNDGKHDDDGVHISSVQRNDHDHDNSVKPSGAIKPVYLTLLRKDAIRSLILQKRPSISHSSSSELSPTEMETIVDQAFRIWVDARIHSIQSNFAIHAVECLLRLRRDIASVPTPSLRRRRRRRPSLYIGAITDGNSDPTSVPQLRDMFDFVIRAEDVGTSKPDRRVYRAAVGELMICLTRDGWGAETFFLGMDDVDDDDDHDPDRTTMTGIVDDAARSWKDLDDETLEAFSEAVGPWWVHVGDDFFKDVVAAKEFGMRSVWVRELIGGAGNIRGSGSGSGENTKRADDDNNEKERTVQDLVEEISKKNGVVEMAIGESNFLMNALHEEFSDAILEKFEDLADLLIGWHREGCVVGVGEDVDENMEREEENASVDEPLPPPNVPPSAEEESQKKIDDKFCVFCGEKLPAAAKFCSGCGERQP